MTCTRDEDRLNLGKLGRSRLESKFWATECDPDDLCTIILSIEQVYDLSVSGGSGDQKHIRVTGSASG